MLPYVTVVAYCNPGGAALLAGRGFIVCTRMSRILVACRPIDELYADRWGSARVGLRGGVLLPKTKPHITVDPLEAIAELAGDYN